MLGSTGGGTQPKASNGRFEAPGKDKLLADVKFEPGCGIDPSVSLCSFLKLEVIGREAFGLVDKGAVIAACGWLGWVGFEFGMG